MSAPDFERIYVPPLHGEWDKIERLITIAVENGFKCLNTTVQKLTEKKNCYIVLEKFKNDLTISHKVASNVMHHLGDDDIELYSPERAVDWVIAKAKETK